jgi:hypothetical protein
MIFLRVRCRPTARWARRTPQPGWWPGEDVRQSPARCGATTRRKCLCSGGMRRCASCQAHQAWQRDAPCLPPEQGHSHSEKDHKQALRHSDRSASRSLGHGCDAGHEMRRSSIDQSMTRIGGRRDDWRVFTPSLQAMRALNPRRGAIDARGIPEQFPKVPVLTSTLLRFRYTAILRMRFTDAGSVFSPLPAAAQ